MIISWELVQYFNFLHFNPQHELTLTDRSLVLNVTRFFAKVIYHTLICVKHFNYLGLPKKKIIFYSHVETMYDAVKSVYDKLMLPKAMVVNPFIRVTEYILFPNFISTFISIFFIPIYLFHYSISEKKNRKKLRIGYDHIISTYGFYYCAYFWFKFYRPLGLVVSNDHCYDSRILIYFANKYNIPSFYIQHASVTEKFPRLEMRYALLEGEDAKEKYLKVGSDATKITLIGMPKLDRWVKKINLKNNVESIGYALNDSDDLNNFLEKLNYLLYHFPNLVIYIRPHPILYHLHFKKQFAKIEKILEKNPHIQISNPKLEPVFEYLSKLDVLIAGDSGIHLEAILVNVYSIYYDSLGNFNDGYGYYKNGLIEKAESIEKVALLINTIKHSRPNVRGKARYYCDTLGTLNDGRSSELAVKFIESNLN